MSAPKLRFKGFDDDWEEALLTDIVHFYNGKGHEGVVDENGEYILINSKFISSDRAVFKRVSECHQKVFDDSLVMVMSDVPNGKALAKFIHIVDGKEYALNQRIGMLVFKEEFSSKFYQYPLNRNKYYLAFDSGVGQTNLRKDEVLECPIYKLSLREQTKIASFLSAVDEKISQLTQKHQLLSQYKQGMMQKLFSQQIRFKADDGSEFDEWEYYKLGELTTLITKGTTPTSLGGKFENSGINFIKIESLSSDGKFLLDKFAYIDEVTHNKLARSQLENEDILFSIAGALGRVAIISNDYLPANTNQALAIIRLRNKNVTQYIYYFLNSDYVKKIIETESVQLAQANFSLGQLSDLDIVLPCHEEQTKIANFLSAIDQKIDVVSEQLEQAKLWKKGLLQQMFV